MKASYRDHLADPSHFTQVVPIRSPTLLAKIHQTHRLHYLKDVVLARILEDSTFSMLNSAIYFNEVDIVNEVSADAAFLRELFAIFDDEDADSVPTTSLASTIGPQLPSSNGPTLSIGPQLPPHLEQQLASSHDAGVHPNFTDIPPPAPGTFFTGDTSPSPCPLPFPSISTVSDSPNLKHDAILFLQQFATMAKNLQIPARAAFFRNLADKGLLRVIEVALSHSITEEDTVMRSATIEILMALVDHDPTNVRAYSLKQHAKGKRPLVVFLIEMFHNELDLGLKQQMSEALRVLVDAGGDGGPLEVSPIVVFWRILC
jgi:protein phosphatase-4 regulatory subunit 3